MYLLSVSEDAELRTLVGKVHAQDADAGVNRKVRYALAAQGTPFSVDAESGLVSVAAPLDRETVAVYNLSVVAVDLGAPALTSAANVSVRVLDVNDNPPEFERHTYFADVDEDAPIGHQVQPDFTEFY